MVRTENGQAWIELHETISIHHEEIFAAITTADGLSRWFPVAAEVEREQGGLIVLAWDEKKRRRTTVAILEFDPGGRIVWDWHAGPEDRHAPIEWRVEPVMEEGSRVLFRQGPFPLDVPGLLLLAGELESWRWYLCNLRAVYEGRIDMRRIRPL
ncbi:MAG: SRPBCC domain-containing protein [Phycisphaeraceae bacterium]|nr:SRPBCC domain-containing protein [Phycisphaeraceae bacterium]